MDPCHKKLESAWTHYREKKDWRMCGKILRDTVNFCKSVDGALAEYEDSLATKIEFLEAMLPEMHFDVSLTVISHIRHARNNLRITDAKFGSAFKRELDTKERRKIRRRNRTPAFGIENGVGNAKDHAGGSDYHDFLAGNLGDEKT